MANQSRISDSIFFLLAAPDMWNWGNFYHFGHLLTTPNVIWLQKISPQPSISIFRNSKKNRWIRLTPVPEVGTLTVSNFCVDLWMGGRLPALWVSEISALQRSKVAPQPLQLLISAQLSIDWSWIDKLSHFCRNFILIQVFLLQFFCYNFLYFKYSVFVAKIVIMAILSWKWLALAYLLHNFLTHAFW